jgi:predicted molibdopterin-dependent oxidoreductase YjgC
MDFRQQFEQKLIEKAMKDESFRKQLIENPGAAIEEETGMKIPDVLKIKVLEEDQQTFYLVLPSIQGNNSELELTEAELESVSGGCTGDLCWSTRDGCE